MSNADKYRAKYGISTSANDPNDYTNLSGPALLSNRAAIRDVRNYYSAKGETFANTQEMWDTFYSDRRWRDVNSISMLKGASEYALAGDGRGMETRLSKLWANAPARGSTWDKVKDYGSAGLLDPINLLGGYGAATKGVKAYGLARAGMATSREALKKAGRAGARQGAITEAGVNAAVGGGFDALQQSFEIQQGVSDEFDVGRVARSAGIDAAVGSVFGGAIGRYQGRKGAQEAVRNAIPTSAIGSSTAARAADLDTQITELNGDLDAATDPNVRDALRDELFTLEQEKRNIMGIEARAADYDAQLEKIAEELAARTKEKKGANVDDLRTKWDALTDERSRMLNSDYENFDYEGFGVNKEDRTPPTNEPGVSATSTDGKPEGVLTNTGEQVGSSDTAASTNVDPAQVEAGKKSTAKPLTPEQLANAKTPEQTRLEETEADVKAAEERLAKAKAQQQTPAPASVAKAQARVDAATATFKEAEAKSKGQPAPAKVELTADEKALLDSVDSVDPDDLGEVYFKVGRGKNAVTYLAGQNKGKPNTRETSIDKLIENNKEFVSMDDVKRLMSQGIGSAGEGETKFVANSMMTALRKLVKARKAAKGISTTSSPKIGKGKGYDGSTFADDLAGQSKADPDDEVKTKGYLLAGKGNKGKENPELAAAAKAVADAEAALAAAKKAEAEGATPAPKDMEEELAEAVAQSAEASKKAGKPNAQSVAQLERAEALFEQHRLATAGQPKQIKKMRKRLKQIVKDKSEDPEVIAAYRAMLRMADDVFMDAHNIADGVKYAELRQDFLAGKPADDINIQGTLDSNTNPDVAATKKRITVPRSGGNATVSVGVDAKTGKRVAGSGEKAANVIETGAGRSIETVFDKKTGERKVRFGKTQAILRRGFSTGGDDGRTVVSIADIPKEGMFNQQSAIARADIDIHQGKGKDVYPFVATGMEPVRDRREGRKFARATKGETLYYVPNAVGMGRVFSNPKWVMFNLGYDTKVGADGTIASHNKRTGYENIVAGEKLPVESVNEFNRLKEELDAKLDEGIITNAEHEAATVDIDRRAGVKVEPASRFFPDADPEADVSEVDTSFLDDLPVKKGNKVLAFFPKDAGKRTIVVGTWRGRDGTKTPQVDDPATTAKTVLGKKVKDIGDYNVGYIDRSYTDDHETFKAIKSNRKAFAEIFEDMNAEKPADKGEIEIPEGMTELGTDQRISLETLSDEQFTFMKIALKVVLPKLNGSKVEQQFKDGIPLDLVHAMAMQLDVLGWNYKFDSGDTLAPGMRAKTIASIKEVLSENAPNGIRRPSVEVEESIRQVRDVMSSHSAATLNEFERIIRLVAPSNVAPIFQKLDKGHADFSHTHLAAGQRGGIWNAIGLNADNIKENGGKGGLTPTFTLSHELGHWVYQNLMDTSDQMKFWKIASKFYDENNEFTTESARRLLEKSPVEGTFRKDGELDIKSGAGNGLNTPAEFFANQFALYLHHHHDALIVTDKSLWGKVTKIVRSLWDKMTGKQIMDAEMVPLFDKLITNKADLKHNMFVMSVDTPATKLGETYNIRYNQWLDSYQGVKVAYADGNVEMFMAHLDDLVAQMDGSTRTVKQAQQAAAKKGEEYRPYSGPLRALSVDEGRENFNNIRASVRQIRKEMAAATKTQYIEGDDMGAMTSYDENIVEDLMAFVAGEDFTDTIQRSMEKMNDWFLQAEGGDIPGYQPSRDITDIGLRTFGERKKSASYKRMMKKNAAARNSTKAKAAAVLKGAATKADANPNAKRADADFDTSSVDMEFALREFPNHLTKDGKPNKIGKALQARVFYLTQTEFEPIDAPMVKDAQGRNTKKKANRNYIKANPAELILRYSEALESGNADLQKKIMFEMQQRKKAGRTSKMTIEPTTQKVVAAVNLENHLNKGIPNEVGIPTNSTYKMRNVLRAFSHRTEEMSFTTKKLAERMMLLGFEFSTDTASASFKEVRDDLRRVAANLNKKEDISQSIETVGRMLVRSNVLETSKIDTIRRSAATLGYDPEEFIVRILRDDLDGNSDKAFLQEIMGTVRGMDGAQLSDAVASVRRDIREGVSYALNGLVSKPEARKRFFNVTAFGDLTRGSSSFKPQSPMNRFAGEVPSDFAEDYANDVIGNMSPSTRNAVQSFTGEANPMVHYVSSLKGDSIFGNSISVSKRVIDRAANKKDEIVDSVTEARQGYAAELADSLASVREGIRNMLYKGNASDDRVTMQFDKERAIVAEIERIGGQDPTGVRAVFIRDDHPAVIDRKMTLMSPVVERLKAAIRAKEDGVLPSRTDAVFGSVRGYYEPAEILEMLSRAANGTTNLRTAMQDAGYTSLTVGSDKSMIDASHIKDIRSTDFIEPKLDIGTKPSVSDPIAYLVDDMGNSLDGGMMGLQNTSQALEMAGVPSRVTDALNRTRRGGTISDGDGRAIRSTAKWTLTNTNAAVMLKNGMANVAHFFEPADGAGGHFERVNARMGRFIVPFQRMLNEQQDAKGFMGRWFNDGVMQMFEATPGSGTVKGSLGFEPSRRTQQPMSHRRIAGALRNKSRATSLTATERKAYDHARAYLDNAVTRLRDAGIMVGNITKNYYPQVWRKDLISANREQFVDILGRYFVRESEVRTSGSSVLSMADAQLRANRVAERLIAQDGVLTGDPAMFRKTGKTMAGKDDHTDFQRLIRLDMDQFAEFTDATRPRNDLSQFLENDLMVVMTKYSDNLEHRLDITKKFGVNGHGFHDYIATLSGGGDAITRLLSSRMVLKRDFKNVLKAGNNDEGIASQVFTEDAFHPPYPNKEAAMDKTQELIDMAKSGRSKMAIKQAILDLVQTSGETTLGAEKMRRNFGHRAEGIAAALTETKGFENPIPDDSLRHAEGMMNATLRKPIDGADGLYNLKSASKYLRSINAVTLLSFTTLTSLGDFVLPLIRSGDFKSYATALQKFYMDPVGGPAYREQVRNIGAATENIVHDRMTKAFGVDNTQFTSGFFTATMLTPWTDAMRDISAAVAFEHFKAQQRIAFEAPNTKQGRMAKRQLEAYGLKKLHQNESMNLDMIMATSGDVEPHPDYYEISTAIHKFANQTIFTPNANDQPLWAQTPTGQIIMQLKSFPLMMTRMGRAAIQASRANADGDRNLKPLLYYAGVGPTFGAGVVATKDMVQGRGGEDNETFGETRDRKLSGKDHPVFGIAKGSVDEGSMMDLAAGWYIDGLMTFGGLGLIGQLFYDGAAQADNGAYGKWRTAEMLAGPSLGLFSDAFDVGGGLMEYATDALGGESTNAKERMMWRELIGRVPILGQMPFLREAGVDYTAGASEN